MKDCYETNEANNFWLYYVGMVIINVLISKDFLVILAFQNGYMCHTGVNGAERSMTKPNEIKPESA